MPQEARTEGDEEDRREGESPENRRGATQGGPFDAPPVVDSAALLHRVPDDLLQQRRPLQFVAFPGGLDRGEDAGLQRRFVLFQVQRHALVRNAAEQRPDHGADQEEGDDEPDDDAEDGDGAGLEAQELEGRGGDEEGEERAGECQGEPPQNELEAPAATDAADDAKELVSGSPVARYGHVFLLCL